MPQQYQVAISITGDREYRAVALAEPSSHKREIVNIDTVALPRSPFMREFVKETVAETSSHMRENVNI